MRSALNKKKKTNKNRYRNTTVVAFRDKPKNRARAKVQNELAGETAGIENKKQKSNVSESARYARPLARLPVVVSIFIAVNAVGPRARARFLPLLSSRRVLNERTPREQWRRSAGFPKTRPRRRRRTSLYMFRARLDKHWSTRQ